jgi:hypothetical protein
LVPLHAQERLVGIVGLTDPIMSVAPDWEDLELVRLVARQSASFVALQQAERAVSEASALSSFNQIAAFIVHDAKTISASSPFCWRMPNGTSTSRHLSTTCLER